MAVIVSATVAGGLAPLTRKPQQAGEGYPLGEAFAAGVFLALSLTMMLPASFSLFEKALPHIDYPLTSLIAIGAMLALLGVSHLLRHMEADMRVEPGAGSSPILAVLMTVMIAVPSFFLGAALGVSDTDQALLILIAILLHKSSAAFALAIKLSDSSLPVVGQRLVFGMFVLATPFGILVGSEVAGDLGDRSVLIVRGVVLAMAAGTFLFMGMLSELQSTPLIRRCQHWRGFAAMLAGLGVTMLARLLIGEAHGMG